MRRLLLTALSLLSLVVLIGFPAGAQTSDGLIVVEPERLVVVEGVAPGDSISREVTVRSLVREPLVPMLSVSGSTRLALDPAGLTISVDGSVPTPVADRTPIELPTLAGCSSTVLSIRFELPGSAGNGFASLDDVLMLDVSATSTSATPCESPEEPGRGPLPRTGASVLAVSLIGAVLVAAGTLLRRVGR